MGKFAMQIEINNQNTKKKQKQKMQQQIKLVTLLCMLWHTHMHTCCTCTHYKTFPAPAHNMRTRPCGHPCPWDQHGALTLPSCLPGSQSPQQCPLGRPQACKLKYSLNPFWKTTKNAVILSKSLVYGNTGPLNPAGLHLSNTTSTNWWWRLGHHGSSQTSQIVQKLDKLAHTVKNVLMVNQRC